VKVLSLPLLIFFDEPAKNVQEKVSHSFLVVCAIEVLKWICRLFLLFRHGFNLSAKDGHQILLKLILVYSDRILNATIFT